MAVLLWAESDVQSSFGVEAEAGVVMKGAAFGPGAENGGRGLVAAGLENGFEIRGEEDLICICFKLSRHRRAETRMMAADLGVTDLADFPRPRCGWGRNNIDAEGIGEQGC